MEANDFLLKSNHGKKTILDREYVKHINKILTNIDEDEEARWETYNIVIQELINQGKGDYFQEIKYRLTDGENPNEVILDIIGRVIDEVDGLIWFLKRRIEEYLEDDYIKKFYK
jgi:hypothetical protein